jgi:hypothetical protein
MFSLLHSSIHLDNGLATKSPQLVLARIQYSTPTTWQQRLLVARPLMVPPLPARVIRLRPSILDGHAAPNPPLNHRTPVQPTNITAPDTQPSRIRTLTARLLFADLVAIRVHQAQVLARRAHRHVLALQLALLGPAALAQEQHPCTVDRPVAEIAVAREVQRARGERVREVVADVCWRTVRLVLL